MSRNPTPKPYTPVQLAKAREILDKVLALLVPYMLKCLPEIEACDPWELSSRVMRGGVTQWTLMIACTERRENGYSNHACARIWVTPSLKIKVDWTHGQGHNYPITTGSVKSFSATNHPDVTFRNIVRHITTYAKHDADVYVIC